MKMPQHELRDYISKLSERADVRAGCPLPFGTQERGGTASVGLCTGTWIRSNMTLVEV